MEVAHYRMHAAIDGNLFRIYEMQKAGLIKLG